MATVKAGYPKKLFYKINEVSRITNLKPYVLRYWETEFRQLKPQKDGNDQRRYRKEDIEMIQQIKTLLYDEKFTIAGARKKLKTRSGSSSKTSVKKKKLKNISKELTSIREELNSLLQKYA